MEARKLVGNNNLRTARPQNFPFKNQKGEAPLVALFGSWFFGSWIFCPPSLRTGLRAQVPVPTAQVPVPTAQVPVPTAQEALNFSASQPCPLAATSSRESIYKFHSRKIPLSLEPFASGPTRAPRSALRVPRFTPPTPPSALPPLTHSPTHHSLSSPTTAPTAAAWQSAASAEPGSSRCSRAGSGHRPQV